MKNPLPISDSEREAKESMSALAVDRDGDEILIGLSREESEWLLRYNRDYAGPPRVRASKEDKAKAKEIREKHNVARLLALGRKSSGITLQ